MFSFCFLSKYPFHRIYPIGWVNQFKERGFGGGGSSLLVNGFAIIIILIFSLEGSNKNTYNRLFVSASSGGVLATIPIMEFCIICFYL